MSGRSLVDITVKVVYFDRIDGQPGLHWAAVASGGRSGNGIGLSLGYFEAEDEAEEFADYVANRAGWNRPAHV